MTETVDQRFPLQWPEGWKRTKNRKKSRFESIKHEPGALVDELFNELKLLGATRVVLSTNVPLRKDGTPYRDGLTIQQDDPGVAIYFERGSEKKALACDTYKTPIENVRALTLTVDALRTMDRHGCSEVLDRAFTGFTALPPAMKDRPWWDVLGVPRDAPTEVVQSAYRDGAKRFHPDAGGSAEAFGHIARAMEQFRKERGA